MKHKLKIKPQYLDNLVSGKKKSEVIFNDRDYQTGDILIFLGSHTLDFSEFHYRITHVHSGLGLKENFVVLSLENVLNG